MPNSPVTDEQPGQGRLLSLDALRGFDMFWILGADNLAQGLKAWAPQSPLARGIAYQLDHAPWVGFRFYDLIFPLFVFIIGVSIVFSLSRRLEQGNKSEVTTQIIRRALILYLLGIISYFGIARGIDGVRLLGVLQRLALCYLFAGLAFTWLSTRGLAILCGSLLIGYWALMSFVPVPGIGAGVFVEGQNLANWVDFKYLPLYKWDGPHDPEGLLSTLPAIASCLLGVFAGLLLRNSPQPPIAKVKTLLIAGVVGIAAGWLWHLQFPIIKKIWTSSYVLVAAGWSAIALATFYYLIDIRGWKRWATPFVWIGMNAITIYMIVHIVPMEDLARKLAGGEIKLSFDMALGQGAGDLWITTVALGLCLLIVRWLYHRRIFIKV